MQSKADLSPKAKLVYYMQSNPTIEDKQIKIPEFKLVGKIKV